MKTHWLRPIEVKRAGGGKTWTNEQYVGTREELMETIKAEMNSYQKHVDHVIYHKTQMHQLLQNFADNELVIKADFIQNIVHKRGRESSTAYYNKRQTQMLTFVV